MLPPILARLTKSQRNNLAEAVNKGLSVLRAPEPLKLSEWADKHFYLSSESSAVEGPWITIPYQKAIMNCMSNDDIETVTFMKCARVGYTKMLVALAGYHIEHKKRGVLIYQPTDGDAEDFSKDEIAPSIRDVSVLRDCFRGDPEKKDKFNTLQKKCFVGAVLDIKGATSPKNFRRMTKDTVIYDELDGFDHNIGDEGSATTLGDTRAMNSPFKKSIRGSTPKLKGESQTEASFKEADLRFRRWLPCPECEEHQPLEWEFMTWTNDDPSTAHYCCKHCGSIIDYSNYADMDARGVWKTDTGEYIDDDDNLRSKDDDIIDWPEHVGFHIWSAYSYYTNWQRIVSRFIKAKQASNKGDQAKLQSFVNVELAETWEVGGETADEGDLLSRREHYAAPVPQGALVLTAGVDVQGDRVEVEVIGFGRDDESWSIEYNVIHGDPAQTTLWDDLDQYLLTKFEHESGVMLPIAAVGIDTGGHHTKQVYSYCKPRFKRRVYAIKGVGGHGKPLIGNPSRSNSGKVHLFPVGVDTAKQLLYSRLKITEPGPGYCHFPAHYDTEYFNQLTGEKLITKYVRGRASKSWVPKSSHQRVEALDCRNYGTAVLDLLNPNFELLEKRIESAANRLREEPQKEQKKRSPIQRNRPKKSNWATKW